MVNLVAETNDLLSLAPPYCSNLLLNQQLSKSINYNCYFQSNGVSVVHDFYRCVAGEGVYLGFDAICKNNKHPSSFGEHACSINFFELYLDSEFYPFLQLIEYRTNN